MKLFSTSIEIAVLKTICSGGKVGDWLLGVADPYLFHTEAGMQTIGRIRKILSTASSVPQWSAILHDPVLSASVRNRLAKSKAGKYSQSKAENAIRLLRTYAAMRKFAGMAAQITTDLEKDSVDIESISDYIAEVVGQVRLGSNTAHMYKFGEGNNTDHIIEDLLTGEGEKGIPTCFQTWDKVNGTIPNSAVMLIGSSSRWRQIHYGGIDVSQHGREWDASLCDPIGNVRQGNGCQVVIGDCKGIRTQDFARYGSVGCRRYKAHRQ